MKSTNLITASHCASRIAEARLQRQCIAVEALESRRLMSAAPVVPGLASALSGATVIDRVVGKDAIVTGRLSTLGEHDWFKIQLQAGDVFGATLKGDAQLDPAIQLVDADGTLLIGNDDGSDPSQQLTAESPLPRVRANSNDSAIYYVIARPGNYYVDVAASADASTGKYSLDVLVARPGLEAAPVGTRQILYLDFNGANVNFKDFVSPLVKGKVTLPAMSASLPDWGLSAADENAVIDGVIAKVKEKLSTFVRANGLNGDFSSSQIPGQFDIDIQNSRDNPDEFGKNPYEARMVIGGTNADVGLPADVSGLGEAIDPGNFKTDDQGILVLDYIKGGLGFIGIQPPKTAIDFVVEGISTTVAHEAGHLFGCFHTDQADTGDVFAGTPNVMDPHSPTEMVGPDLVLGTSDDANLELGTDIYRKIESFTGSDDTLNTVAFGLSTGTRGAAKSEGMESWSARANQPLGTTPMTSAGGTSAGSLFANPDRDPDARWF